jgi:hypothetical protein
MSDEQENPAPLQPLGPPSEHDEQVQNAVMGTIVDWARKLQVNPKTGEKFDFRGNRI